MVFSLIVVIVIVVVAVFATELNEDQIWANGVDAQDLSVFDSVNEGWDIDVVLAWTNVWKVLILSQEFDDRGIQGFQFSVSFRSQ